MVSNTIGWFEISSPLKLGILYDFCKTNMATLGNKHEMFSPQVSGKLKQPAIAAIDVSQSPAQNVA